MKKLTSSIVSLTAVILIILSLSSCARKVGCYFSSTPGMESIRNDFAQRTQYASDNCPEVYRVVSTCD